MEENVKNNPTPEQMKLIWKDTYNLYLKWKDIDKDEDFYIMAEEARSLNRKYPFEMCTRKISDLLEVITIYYETRKGMGQ